jgi:mannosyl-oligosaccharide alpha-1,2-mannosidase
MLLIRRLWVLPALFLAAVFYYLFLYPSSNEQSYNYDPIGSGNGPMHWIKRPEKYPVTEFSALPTGPSKTIPRIQFDFSQNPETPEQKRIREERRDKVKESFLHSWHGYKKHAWGKDEIAPVSGTSRDAFGGWGATLVDAMDTLWIMRLKKDFEETVDFASKIDFTTNTEESLNVFETTIRYLGGLMAAYDLSGAKYPVLLNKAKELGDILYSAFDTPNRMPVCRWQWKKAAIGGSLEAAETTLLAEFGSLTLEFTRLSQLTGDNKYFDAVQRVTSHMNLGQNSTSIPGLWPTVVNAKKPAFEYNHFTFGGMADSTYEYLPKEYLLLGGQDSQYQTMYETAIEAGKQHLFFRPMIPTNSDILYSGNAQLSSPSEAELNDTFKTYLDPQGQHLTCFVAGMVAIGSRIFSRPSDLPIAKRLLEGCLWAYAATPSGLMPETFHLLPCHTSSDLLPKESTECDWSDAKWYTAIAHHHGSDTATKDLTPIERGKLIAKEKNLLPGFVDHGDNRYILRPEAIESVFILYRITGERRYQEAAWQMFLSIEKATRTDVAHAAVHDVRVGVPAQSDRMESFWLAETLKYFYLVFAEAEEVSLDEWVLNTEAHPFRRPR